MAGRLFPEDRAVLTTDVLGGLHAAGAGLQFVVYRDQARTVLAGITDALEVSLPGSVIATDAAGLLPYFRDPLDGDLLYASFDGAAAGELRPVPEERLAALEMQDADDAALLAALQAADVASEGRLAGLEAQDAAGAAALAALGDADAAFDARLDADDVADQSALGALEAADTALGERLDALETTADGLPETYASVLPSVSREHIYDGVTYDRAVVALRFDDGPANDQAIVLPNLKARNLVAGFAINSGLVGQVGRLTWPQVLQAQTDGHEIMCHTVNHGAAPADYDGFAAEVDGCTAALEAQNLYVQSFVQPGSWLPAGPANPYYFDSYAKLDSVAGRHLQERYAAAEGYVPDFYVKSSQSLAEVRRLPVSLRYGASHVTGEARTLAQLQGMVDDAVTVGGYVEIVFHSSVFDTSGFATTATFTGFLDYLQARRDAGLVDVLTPTGALYAKQSNTKVNLLADPSFEQQATGTLRWWQAIGAPAISAAGGRGGGKAVQVSAGNTIRQFSPATALRTVRLEGYARSATAGVAAVARLRLYFYDAATSAVYAAQNVTLGVGDGWSRLVAVCGNDRRATHFMAWLDDSGTGVPVMWDDMALVKL